MAKTIRIPVLGQSVEEVRIVRWLRQVGDAIEAGDPLAEVETDKTNIEWEAPESGTILKILAAEGDYVAVEAPALIVGAHGESVDDVPAPMTAAPSVDPSSASPTPSPESVPTPVVVSAANSGLADGSGAFSVSPRALRLAAARGISPSALAGLVGSGPKGRIVERDIAGFQIDAVPAVTSTDSRPAKVSPLAKAVAGQSGADLSGIRGSGEGGRIVAADVHGVTPPAAVVPTAEVPGAERIPMTGLRRRVAENLARSVREKPHVTLNTRVDVGEMMRLRKALLPRIEAETGIRISPTDFIVWASAKALVACPWMNGHVFDDSILRFAAANVGLAVSLGTDGLVVPVMQGAQRLRLAELVAERARVVELARSGKLAPSDMAGGTFTVTNLGNYGIDSFDPIIPPPQIAILGVGSIREEMGVRDGQPVVRSVMGLSLSFDHRAVDGAPAAEFLQKLVSILENPIAEMG